MSTRFRLSALAAGSALATLLAVQLGAAQEGAGRSAPPKENAVVERLVGEWTITVEGMGMPPTEGTSSIEMLGGWAVERVESSMMGQPFQGLGLHGWDPKRGKYVGVWIDNSKQEFHLNESTWDESKESFVSEPKEMETFEGPVEVRSEIHLEGEDSIVYTETPTSEGAEPIFTVEYERKKEM